MPSHQIDLQRLRKDAADIFKTAVNAVAPRLAIHRFCQRQDNQLKVGSNWYDLNDYSSIYVIGAGKAGAAMAVAVEDLIRDRITDGIVVVKYHHRMEIEVIRIMEAGHPIPDPNGEHAAEAVLAIAKKAQKGDLVICLLSGGGSALLPLPADGVRLVDKKETIRILLDCGATIHEINTVRKHLSAIKGGRLAEAVYPARLITLIISDVVGDDLDVIASGPTVPDLSTFQQCMEIVRRYDLTKRLPSAVLDRLTRGSAGKIPENPKPDHPIFQDHLPVVVGGNRDALMAAREKAISLGYNCLILSAVIEGETRQTAKFHMAIAKEIRRTGNPVAPPVCVLSGGETTVTISGKGKGGRNQEFALAAAMELKKEEGIVVLSGGTDGTDGPTDAAGAFADPESLLKAAKLSLNPSAYLNNNDSYHFFQRLGDLFITGPTYTNVMDIRIMLIR